MNERLELDRTKAKTEDKSGLKFNGTYCPRCFSTKILFAPDSKPCNGIGSFTVVCICRDCLCKWVNIYSLTQYIELSLEDIAKL